MQDDSRLIASVRAEIEQVERTDGIPADGFPGYRVVREIHRGNQGVVYQAVQVSTGQAVAIKVMRLGAHAGDAERLRFDREVRILGRLQHPNIVSIHDTGQSAGLVFFVMDHIRGAPLDAWCERQDVPLAERLSVFAKVCDAVHAAHLKGVIHRDLKPGNIQIDARGEPHVLDFGLAKLDEEVAGPLMTRTGQFVGSVPWSAPEQAEGAPELVDVRSDVYALGVILYQMLTGTFPYEVTGNLRAVLDRIAREPPRPPRALRPELDGDLETIVLTCLAKEPERRYQSAGDLLEDVRAWRLGEPIAAKRDSGWYVLRKQIRRHRVAVGAAAGLLVMLLAGFVVCFAFWQRAEDARRDAEDARDLARAAEAEAEAARRLAEGDAASTRRVNDVLTEVVIGPEPETWQADLPLVVASPASGDAAAGGEPGRDALLGRLRRVRARLADDADPRSRAEVHELLGRAFFQLGRVDEALPEMDAALATRAEALGREHAATLETAARFGEMLSAGGAWREAEATLRPWVTHMEVAFGAEDEVTLRAQRALGHAIASQGRLEEGTSILRETRARAADVLGESDAFTWAASIDTGLWLALAGDEETGTEYVLSSLAFRRGERLDELVVHRVQERVDGLFVEVETEAGEARGAARLVTTDDGRLATLAAPLDGDGMRAVAPRLDGRGVRRFHLRGADDWEHVEALWADGLDGPAFGRARLVVQRREAVLGPRHPDTITAKSRLAWELRRLPDGLAEAETLAREAWGSARETWGERHLDTLLCRQTLSVLVHLDGRPDEAASLLDGLLATADEVASGAPLWLFRWTHAAALREMRREADAEPVLLAACEGLLDTLGPDDARTRDAIGDLVALSDRMGKASQASRWRERLEG